MKVPTLLRFATIITCENAPYDNCFISFQCWQIACGYTIVYSFKHHKVFNCIQVLTIKIKLLWTSVDRFCVLRFYSFGQYQSKSVTVGPLSKTVFSFVWNYQSIYKRPVLMNESPCCSVSVLVFGVALLSITCTFWLFNNMYSSILFSLWFCFCLFSFSSFLCGDRYRTCNFWLAGSCPTTVLYYLALSLPFPLGIL